MTRYQRFAAMMDRGADRWEARFGPSNSLFNRMFMLSGIAGGTLLGSLIAHLLGWR